MLSSPVENQLIVKSPGRLWTPVYCRPQQEKKFYAQLRHAEIPSYLPLKKRLHRYPSGNKIFWVPLLSGYVFAALAPDERLDLRSSTAVVKMLPINPDQEDHLIGELQLLRGFELLGHQQELIVKPEFVPGSKVKITSGFLKDTFAIVKKRKDSMTLSVNFELLGCSVTTEVQAHDMELL